jgi:benzoyl-CoA reductase subunit C
MTLQGVKLLDSLLQSYSLAYTSPAANPFVREWREGGGGVVGYLCNVPKEMIYAAGMLPIRLLGNTDPLKDAYSHFPTVFCHFARSLMEVGIGGDYRDLDGIVSINMCDAGVHISNAMQTTFGHPFHFVNRPHDTGLPSAYDFFRQEINKFKLFLEKLAGRAITPESLAGAIRLYNENRALLKELYALRGEGDAPLLTGPAVSRLTYVSQVLPPDVNIRLLSGIIGSVRGSGSPQGGAGPRIHVSGSIMQDLTLYSLVEECGGMIVSDDLCSGLRLFRDTIPEGGDPMEAVTGYYLEKAPCPVMHTKGVEEQRLADIMHLTQRYRAAGVIFCLQKYCDPHQFDLPFLESSLRQAGIPVLTLEVDRAISPEQLRTRLQAFMEILG